jgi:general secretion pathway protein H
MTTPTGFPADRRGDSGFTLIEIVCVLAIVALLAAMLIPVLPRGTSRAALESYAIATAALLKADHDAAIRAGTQIATQIDTASRLVRSGATDRVVRIPDDVQFDTLLARYCSHYPTRSAIRFFSSGMSCGGAIALTRLGFGYQIRVNWLTGRVDIVALNPA